MKPEYLRLGDEEDIPEDLKNRWRELLQEGEIFFYPTETLYGIGTSPYRDEWVQKIYDVKGRPEIKPLPLIADSVASARKAWAEWNPLAERLVNTFWPGPLTIVLRANSELPALLHAKTGKIGVRVSSHPVARLIAELAGGLIISTSANPSGEEPISHPSRIPEEIKKHLAVIIDAGPLSGLPSTVVDCSGGRVNILREGAIPGSRLYGSI
ncbi:MAG: L-threonylcarbamoyladenylate synthase [Thermodesulforhabdaceae bacterium]|jgi:L-threonylcarbamoyladenylate synthase